MGSVLSSEKIALLQDACLYYGDKKTFSIPELLKSINAFTKRDLPRLISENYKGDRIAPSRATLERFMGYRGAGTGIKKGTAVLLEDLLDVYIEQYRSDLTGTFTSTVVDLVASSAGNLCSKCRRPTSFRDSTSQTKYKKIGRILHIEKPSLTVFSKTSFNEAVRDITDESNGIWLCGICYATIENARSISTQFGSKELREMRQIHEKFVEEAGRSGKDLVLDINTNFVHRPDHIRQAKELANHIDQLTWLTNARLYKKYDAVSETRKLQIYLEQTYYALQEEVQLKIIINTISRIVILFENTLVPGAGKTEKKYSFLAMRHMIGIYLAATRRIYNISLPKNTQKLLPPFN